MIAQRVLTGAAHQLQHLCRETGGAFVCRKKHARTGHFERVSRLDVGLHLHV